MYCCTCAVNATVLHLFVTKYAWHQQTGIALSTISPALPPPPLRSLPLSLCPLLNCDKLSKNNFKKLYPILCNIYSRLPSVENRSSSSPSFRCLWNVVSCGYRSIFIHGSSRWRTELISYGKWIVIYKKGLAHRWVTQTSLRLANRVYHGWMLSVCIFSVFSFSGSLFRFTERK